jgi:putative ABC transport system permease protein
MVQDLRFAFRLFARQRGFFLLVVLAIGFGIGLSATVFAFVDGVLFRPLPYRDPGHLYAMFGAVRGDNPGSRLSVSPADLADWKAMSHSWSALEAFEFARPVGVELDGSVTFVPAAGISAGLLQTLGVEPAIGRPFVPADFAPGAPPVALMTFEAWQRVLAGDSAVLGRTVGAGPAAATIVGILPPGFLFPNFQARGLPDILRPMLRRDDPTRATRSLSLIGRIRDGVTSAQAATEMNAIALALKPRYHGPATFHPGAFDSAMVIPLAEHLSVRARGRFLTIFGSVLLVLLLTCVNACALLLARGSDRARELGVRSALGASRSRLVRQLFVESMVICVTGALVGIAAAGLGIRVIATRIPGNLLLLKTPQMDVRLLGFVCLVTAAASILAGLWPALRFSNTQEFCSGSAAVATATRRGGPQLLLLGAEMALATALVVGGTLMLSSLWKIYSERIGLSTDRVLTLGVGRLPGPQQEPPDFARVMAGIRALPEVESAGLTTGPLLDNGNMGSRFRFPPGVRWIDDLTVSSEYFETLGIPLIAGRVFRSGPSVGAEVVVSRALQQAAWPNQNPIGQRLSSSDGDAEVVGVVEDARDVSLDRVSAPTVYLPVDPGLSAATLLIRTRVPPLAAVDDVRRALRVADPTLLVSSVKTLRERADRSIAERRFNTVLFGLFGVAGLALAGIGVYGIVAYAIARRFRELGIRRALGAGSWRIAVAAAGAPLSAALVGVLVGLGAAYSASQSLRAFVYEIAPTAPWIYAMAGGILLLAAVAASWAPIRRATRIDPMIALRAA